MLHTLNINTLNKIMNAIYVHNNKLNIVKPSFNLGAEH